MHFADPGSEMYRIECIYIEVVIFDSLFTNSQYRQKALKSMVLVKYVTAFLVSCWSLCAAVLTRGGL